MTIDAEEVKKNCDSGIYSIRHIASGKQYIGSAINLSIRNYEHFRLLRHGKHTNKHLQYAFSKYGENSFEFIIIENCFQEALTAREQFWMDHNRADGLYNICPTARSQLGFKHSEESRKKIGDVQRGKKRPRSPEHQAKITASLKGKKHSKERIEKNRTAHLGQIISSETRKLISASLKKTTHWKQTQILAVAANKGTKRSNESRAKMRAAHLGIRLGAIHRNNLAIAIHSPEVRQKISAALKGRKVPQSTLEKRSATISSKKPQLMLL